MIKMSYEQLMSHPFMMSMQKITSIPLPTKTAYQLKKVADECQRLRNIVGEEYRAQILEVYAKKGEDGKIIEPLEITPDKQVDFDKAQIEFGKKEVTIDRHKISLDMLGDVKLTAADLSALDSIIQEHATMNETGPAMVRPIKGGA